MNSAWNKFTARCMPEINAAAREFRESRNLTGDDTPINTDEIAAIGMEVAGRIAKIAAEELQFYGVKKTLE